MLANRCEVVELLDDADGQTSGVVVDTGDGRTRVRAHTVVSATGVWADEIRALVTGADADSIRPAKGVHVTVPWSMVRNEVAVIISVPGDKRSLFVVPWGERPDGGFDHAYIGTTDTDFDGDVDAPQTDAEDLDYVLGAVNQQLDVTITHADVTGVWAGLRPLVKQASSGRTADLSRQHAITTDDSGMITVTGGKLTTYREMAQDTVDLVAERVPGTGRSRTKRLRLVGAGEPPPNVDRHLIRRYGTEASDVLALAQQDRSLLESMVPGLPYLRVEAIWAVRHEMASTLVDVVTRRTRAHLQDRAACLAAAGDVARLIGPELGWSTSQVEREVGVYREFCDREMLAATTTGSERA